MICVISWIVCLAERTEHPRNHTNGHEQELNNATKNARRIANWEHLEQEQLFQKKGTADD